VKVLYCLGEGEFYVFHVFLFVPSKHFRYLWKVLFWYLFAVFVAVKKCPVFPDGVGWYARHPFQSVGIDNRANGAKAGECFFVCGHYE